MNRYVLRFQKLGNMRFISHLDLVRLFKRAIKKAGIKVAYSNGYNPHELINVVQPLSLGYESLSEYFEIDTLLPIDTAELAELLNHTMPEGIKFTDCREKERTSNNLSSACETALYEAVLPLKSDAAGKLPEFLAQDRILILKKDKKTKKLVEKDIKDMIFSVEQQGQDPLVLKLMLRCASNETLNPGKLLESYFRFAGLDTDLSDCRIIRIDLLGKNSDGKLVSLYETF
jgi:radical SAM-linked protein